MNGRLSPIIKHNYFSGSFIHGKRLSHSQIVWGNKKAVSDERHCHLAWHITISLGRWFKTGGANWKELQPRVVAALAVRRRLGVERRYSQALSGIYLRAIWGLNENNVRRHMFWDCLLHTGQLFRFNGIFSNELLLYRYESWYGLLREVHTLFLGFLFKFRCFPCCLLRYMLYWEIIFLSL